MKVCHLTSVHPAEDIRIYVKECRYLSQSGLDVTLVVGNSETYIKDDVKIVGVPIQAGNRYVRILKGPIKIYQKALEIDADVYHFHDPELLPVGVLLQRKGKKVIYDVHEDVPEQVLSKEWIPAPFRRLISKAVKGIEKYASSRFSAVVTATPTINKRFETYNANSVVIHNFPIMNELTIDETSQENMKKETAIYIGGITRLRGISEMVDAFEIINHHETIPLSLAGKFSPEKLEGEMKGKSGWQFVDHAGWLSREEVKESLSRAFVGLVLLHPEPRYIVSYPIKLFEYMSAGIPVIASNFPLWEQIVHDSGCGVCVDPLNPEAISDAVLWFYRNPEEAKKMGASGRKAIIEKYNWEKEAERLVELYRAL